jgi:hypothetical protein
MPKPIGRLFCCPGAGGQPPHQALSFAQGLCETCYYRAFRILYFRQYEATHKTQRQARNYKIKLKMTITDEE